MLRICEVNSRWSLDGSRGADLVLVEHRGLELGAVDGKTGDALAEGEHRDVPLAKSRRLFLGVREQSVERQQQAQPALERPGLLAAVTDPAADLVAVEEDVDRDVPGLDAHEAEHPPPRLPSHRGDPLT